MFTNDNFLAGMIRRLKYPHAQIPQPPAIQTKGVSFDRIVCFLCLWQVSMEDILSGVVGRSVQLLVGVE